MFWSTDRDLKRRIANPRHWRWSVVSRKIWSLDLLKISSFKSGPLDTLCHFIYMLRVKFRVQKVDGNDDWDLLRIYYWNPNGSQDAKRSPKEYIYRSDPVLQSEFEFECTIATRPLRDGTITVETKKGGFDGFFDRKRWQTDIHLVNYVHEMGKEHRFVAPGDYMVLYITIMKQSWDTLLPITDKDTEIGYFCESPVQLYWESVPGTMVFGDRDGKQMDIHRLIWSGSVIENESFKDTKDITKLVNMKVEWPFVPRWCSTKKNDSRMD